MSDSDIDIEIGSNDGSGGDGDCNEGDFILVSQSRLHMVLSSELGLGEQQINHVISRVKGSTQDSYVPLLRKFLQECGMALPVMQIRRLYESNPVPWYQLVVDNCHDTDYQEGLMDYVAIFSDWQHERKLDLKAAVERLGGSMEI